MELEELAEAVLEEVLEELDVLILSMAEIKVVPLLKRSWMMVLH